MLTQIEQKMLMELIERRGVDAVLLGVSAVAAIKSVALEDKGDNSASDKWNEFADRMNYEYVWCRKHLF